MIDLNRNRERGIGEFVLRFARSRNIGDRKFLGRLFRNEDEKFMAQAMTQEWVEERVGAGASFTEIFQWLLDHQEEIKAFIEMLIAMFAK